MPNELWTVLEPFFQHVINSTAPMESNVASTSDAASLHPVGEPASNECGLIPHQNATDRDRSNLILSSLRGSLNVSSSTVRLRDYADAVCQEIIRPPKGGELTSDQGPCGIGAYKNGDLGNIPGLAVTSSSGDSGSSNSSSWTGKTSFEERVILEPWPVTHNRGFESSIQNRIGFLESQESIFLLDKEKGVYWAEIKGELQNCSSQKEYDRLLTFENRDLQIREQKHAAYSIFKEILAQDPALEKNAAYNPEEAFVDFVTEKRDALDHQGGDVVVMDQREINFLNGVSQDLRRRGPNSPYLREILYIK